MGVDRALVRLEGDAVDGVEELRPGEDPAGLAGERGEERELGRRQVDRPAGEVGPHPRHVERQVAGPDHLVGRVVRACASTRRRTARTRATSSRGLNGFVR